MVFSRTAANSHSFHCFRLLLLMKNKWNSLGAEECCLKRSQYPAATGVYGAVRKGAVSCLSKRGVSRHNAQCSSVPRLHFSEAFGALRTQQENPLEWLDGLPYQQIEMIP